MELYTSGMESARALVLLRIKPHEGAGGAIGFLRGSPEATAEDQRASPVTTGASDAALAKT